MMRKLAIYPLVVISILALSGAAMARGGFTANLSGGNEVPAVETDARGQFIARVQDGELSYRLVVANIENVVAAHIHCAPEDANGPVGVTLFLGSPTTINGILASGPILAPNPGNACLWADIDDVLAAMESGDTYVNVHTLQNLPGEIRGQIR